MDDAQPWKDPEPAELQGPALVREWLGGFQSGRKKLFCLHLLTSAGGTTAMFLF